MGIPNFPTQSQGKKSQQTTEAIMKDQARTRRVFRESPTSRKGRRATERGQWIVHVKLSRLHDMPAASLPRRSRYQRRPKLILAVFLQRLQTKAVRKDQARSRQVFRDMQTSRKERRATIKLRPAGRIKRCPGRYCVTSNPVAREEEPPTHKQSSTKSHAPLA